MQNQSSSTHRHSNLAPTFLAVALAGTLFTTGCAWDPSRLNLDKLRDDRAVEMDSRLSAEAAIVENPFRQAKSEE